MGLVEEMKERVKKFTVLDMKLAQGSAVCAGLIAAKYFPEITQISVWWFVGALVLCAAKPMYVFFLGRK